MSEQPPSSHAFRVSDLPRLQDCSFEVRPDAAVLQVLARDLDLLALRKLSFAGDIDAVNDTDWRVRARLGATVVQPCGVTLEPVTTRLDTPVVRVFQRDFSDVDTLEAEMPDDDTTEPLGRWIDPQAIMIEALTLALPLYPRKDDAALGEQVYAGKGVTPMRDEDARPFAGLASLKEAMTPKTSDEDEDKT
ncbi:MAG: DUF177 domain-containing protein [Roseobacter sp.]